MRPIYLPRILGIGLSVYILYFAVADTCATADDSGWQLVYSNGCWIDAMTLFDDETIVFSTENLLCFLDLESWAIESVIETTPLYRSAYCHWGPHDLWLIGRPQEPGLPPLWRLTDHGAQPYYPFDVNGFGKVGIQVLWVDQNSHPWVAADLSIQMYDGAEWQVLLSPDDVMPVTGAIGPGPGGTLTGTQFGIFEWTLSGEFKWLYTSGNTGLPLKMPNEIYKDSRDIYWICGPHALLGFREGFVFSLYERADISSAVSCMDEDEAGNLWFGTSGDGVIVVSADGSTITHIPFEADDKWINNILCAPDGMTYVVTRTGLYAIER